MKTISLRGGVVKLAATIGSLLLLLTPHKVAAEGWTRVDFASQYVSAIRVAPSNDDTIYALSSGDSSATPRLLDASLDGGGTWNNRTLPAAPADIAVDPKNDRTVYLASTGIYKSTDAGVTWSKLNSVFQSMFKLIVVAPSDGNVLYAETANGLLVGSKDAGATWTFLFNKAFSNGLVLVVDPKDPLSLWAGETNFLWHSTNGAISWSEATSLQFHILGFAIDPIDTRNMYMTGNDHIWKSVDGGVSWSDFGEGYYQDSVHTRQSGQIQLSPGDPGCVYLADDGYFFKDAGGLWSSTAGGAWAPVDGFSENIFSLAVSRSAVWIGTKDGLYVNKNLTSVKKPAIQRPVLVIPGILGSWNFGLGWMLDPFLHTYDNLLSDLRDAGYKDDQTLFTFPYEWRDSVELNADRLASKIGEIKARTGAPAVDVIAHSMGGLVLRQYVEGNNYAEDVGKVVFVAVPHRGAPAAYEGLEGGDIYFAAGLLGELAKAYFGAEAAANGFPDVVSYVRQRVASAAELLPDYPYIADLPGLILRPLGPGYPANPLLPILNQSSKIDAFNARVSTTLNLAGDLGSSSTTSGFRVAQRPDESRYLWPHGIPDGFPDSGIEMGSGDLAVPLVSSGAFWSKTTISADHGGAATVGADKAIEFLDGAPAPHFSAPIPEVTRMLIFQAHSPVRLEVSEPDGTQIKEPGPGPDGAYYTGQGEFQIVTIPNPADGQYQINVIGTGPGKYQIDEELAGDNVPKKSSLVGYIQPGSQAPMATTVNGDAATSLKSLDQTPPTTGLTISGAEGSNGWYTSPKVDVSLSAVDDSSGVGRTEYELDGSAEWTEYSGPFSVAQGSHVLRFRSWDVSGNVEQVEAAHVLVDALPPEIDLTVPATVLREGALSPATAVGDLDSGVSWQKLSLDGVAQLGPIALSGLALGEHSLELDASDVAGNTNRAFASFRLVVDLPLLKADLQRLSASKQIKSLGLQLSLLVFLEDAGKRRRLRFYLHDLRKFCRRVQEAKPKEISLQAQAKLVEEARFLINQAQTQLASGKNKRK